MKKVKILEKHGYLDCICVEFETELNELLEEGWELSGDMNMQVAIANYQGAGEESMTVIYSQRLVKEV